MGIDLAVLGATGLVGREIIKLLEERNFPVDNLSAYASARSRGEKIAFKNKQITVEKLDAERIADCEIYLSSLPGSVSQVILPKIAREDRVIIDNSSAFRMDEDVPLIVPEINGDLLEDYRGIAANPNCSTIQMVVVLHPLAEKFGLKRVTVTTMQSVSGSGQRALEALLEESREFLDEGRRSARHYAHPIAFNLLPAIDYFHDNNYSNEEMKMVRETRKILSRPDLEVNPTCVRVPVMFGHAESCQVELGREFKLQAVRETLEDIPGIAVLDDPHKDVYPLAIETEKDERTLVGRLRKDLDRSRVLNFYCAANNIRKGAALNAVQIAERYLQVRKK